jgi:hypothetical protein
MKGGVKIFLYIGIFLLLIGVCLYGYLSYEGFQATSGTSGTCGYSGTAENFCPTTTDYRCPNDMKYTQCLNTTPEPNAIGDETPDESMLYDIYESKNLYGVYDSTNVSKTTVQPYNMALELGEFDLGAPIPWDYDNRQMDPEETVWGSIHPDVSTSLFQKSYTRALFGSANPEQYIESNNETGENKYRSNMFQMTVYGMEGVAIMSQIDAIGGYYLEQVMEDVLDRIFMPDKLKRWKEITAIIDAGKPDIIGPGNIVLGKKWWAKSTVTYQQAVAQYNDPQNLRKRVFSEVWATQDAEADKMEARYKNNDPGKTGVNALTKEGKAALDKKLKKLEKDTYKENLRTQRAEILKKDQTKSVQSAFKTSNNLRRKWNKSSYTKKALGTILKPVGTALSLVARSRIKNATRKYTGLFVKLLAKALASIVMTQAVLAGMCATAAASAAAAASLSWTGIGLVLLGGSVAYSTSCNIALAVVTLLELSLITWIPALMSQLVDEQISVCPSTHPWNIKQAFYDRPGGEAGWEIFSNIPMVGDIAGVLGPYICWGTPNGLPDAVLKQEISSPYYYYDPTLSIYTAIKKYAKTANPVNPTVFDQITSGVRKESPEYTNHYLYTDNYGLYPFLVDFSHRDMLNKMAQYYYETSRKNMAIDPDGTGRFEYISKIYGIISSSELSCDIQCEISEITVDTLRGTKLCERIVPVPYDAPAWYHDRRFYFYVDISKGISLVTPDNEKCEFYLNYVQSPTFNRPYPSCNDFSSGTSGTSGSSVSSATRTSAECKRLLDWDRNGFHSVYKIDKTIDFDRVTTAGVSCNKKLLQTNGRGINRTSGIGANPTDGWDPQTRMNDNMEKYIVTGCTFVDWTAPDVYDSKNQNVEGIQVGDTPVSVGPIDGKWHPPEFVPEALKMPNENGVLVDIEVYPSGAPTDTSCDIVRSRFTKYGTVSRSDKRLDEAALNAQIANITNIQPSCKEFKWDKSAIQDWNDRERPISGVDFTNVAKKINVIWMDCRTGDVNCLSKRQSFWINMGVGSVLGFIGSKVTFNGLPAGAMIAAGANTIGLQAALTCMADDIKNQPAEGTFVQNGILKTSHQGLFILDHGPTIQYSPGYIPTIRISPPELTIQNCVNRYTVRKFISLFKTKYTSVPKYNLTKILGISPRHVTSSNANPMCVFDIEYERTVMTGANTETTETLYNRMRMDMVLNNMSILPIQLSDKTKNLKLYQPGNNISFDNIPLPEPFQRNTVEPLAPTSTVSDIRPMMCDRSVNCSDPALQARLFEQFNERHLGVFINYNDPPSTGTGGTGGTGTSGTAIAENPIRVWTPLPEAGMKSCIFDINFEKFDYNSSGKIVSTSPPTIQRRRVTMYLDDIQDSTADTACLYDLGSDDYPTNIWYKKIPLTYFDVPLAPPRINTRFQRFKDMNPSQCTAVADCSSVQLMDRIITQFNNTHKNRKINSVYRTFTPFVDDGTGNSKTVCDYDVEMLRTDRSVQQTLANQETVRFYLKPASIETGGSDSSNSCLYDYDSSYDITDNTNTGDSLNTTQLLGLLATPYTWSSNFLYDVRQQIYDAILPVLGLDIVNTTHTMSVNAKNTMKVIYDNTTLIQELQACPALKCNDPYLLQKILNRYNFHRSPAYPDPRNYEVGAQYGVKENRIIEFRRAGIASPTRCHVELIESINTYTDFLYDAKLEEKRVYVQKYQFDITGNSCINIGVKPITTDDIEKGLMNIKGDSYGIDSDNTIVNPKGQSLINPAAGTSSTQGSFGTFSYTSPVVNCMDPAILSKVQLAYEKCDVSSSNVSPRKPAFNRMIKVLEWFNPAPNICEYKMNIQHVYFDLDYGYYYSLPDATQNSSRDVVSFSAPATFSADDEPSYIVAKWVPVTDYDIETGILKLNRPLVDEYFYPDLSLRDGKFYRTVASTTPLNLPYLASQGLSGAGSSNPNGVNYDIQMKRFQTGASHTFTVQDQTAWKTSSCRCVPDQSIDETLPTFCS